MVLVLEITKEKNGRFSKSQADSLEGQFNQLLLKLATQCRIPIRIGYKNLTGKIRLA